MRTSYVYRVAAPRRGHVVVWGPPLSRLRRAATRRPPNHDVATTWCRVAARHKPRGLWRAATRLVAGRYAACGGPLRGTSITYPSKASAENPGYSRASTALRNDFPLLPNFRGDGGAAPLASQRPSQHASPRGHAEAQAAAGLVRVEQHVRVSSFERELGPGRPVPAQGDGGCAEPLPAPARRGRRDDPRIAEGYPRERAHDAPLGVRLGQRDAAQSDVGAHLAARGSRAGGGSREAPEAGGPPVRVGAEHPRQAAPLRPPGIPSRRLPRPRHGAPPLREWIPQPPPLGSPMPTPVRCVERR
eukprot:scaffold31432_cov69-Phaeocystis_antarctica.AAC.5